MMTFDLLAITDKMIEIDDIKEITSSKLFIRIGETDPEGLASYEIFGYPGTIERKNKLGYINLNSVFVNPHVIFELCAIKKIYHDLIYGYGEFYFKDGDIFKVTPDSPAPSGSLIGSGVSFLYKIWDKLNFEYKQLESGMRYNRLRFLKCLDKNQVFMNKILVIPPFYRDVDIREGGNKNVVNAFYIKILNLAQTLKSTSSLFGSLDTNGVSDAYRSITDSMCEFHKQMIAMYGGRKGFIHKYIMGKNIDFSARLVISGLDITQVDKPSEMDVDFIKCKLPLFAAIKCFAPFIINGVREVIIDYLKGSDYIIVNKKTNSGIGENRIKNKSKIANLDYIDRIKLADDWKSVLTSAYIYNLIEIFHESPEHRLDIVKLPTEDGGEVNIGFYIDKGDDYDLDEDIASASSRIKPLRLLQLFYMVAYDKLINKHIYITRYPIEDHNNTYPSGITIIPYKRTEKLTIGDTFYPHFPSIETNDIRDINSMFVDSLVIFPIFLGALGADFDGDMVSIIGVFSNEANDDARNHIMSIGNMVAIDGTSTREVGALNRQVIHGLTF